MDSPRPAPGPVAAVNLREARAAPILDGVRRRVATWADPASAIRRASDAVKLSSELVARGAMASAMSPTGSGVIALASCPQDRPLWIVGDVRGDVLALATALAFVDEADAREDRAFVAFLGDWTGGTAGDAACAAMVLERFNAAPDRTLLLRGDREWRCDAPGAAIAPGLEAMPVPQALCDEHLKLAAQLRSLAGSLPALALLPDGVALAHGSLPRLARMEGLDTLEALGRHEPALRDCALGRLHPSEARVAATGREGGVLLGAEDFAACAARVAAVCGRTVTRLVRGQDGVPEGFRWFSAYGEGAVLTVTTMTDPIVRSGVATRRRPCVARLKAGVIRVVRLEIPEEACFLCDQLFPRRAQASEGAAVPHPTATGGPIASDGARGPLQPASTTGTSAMPAGGAAPPTAVLATPGDAAATEALALFERGVRLLGARAWGGALECFEKAGRHAPLRSITLLNEAVACLWLGPARHQDALARLRELIRREPRDAAARLNLGIALLAGERNPIEAAKALRVATELEPALGEAWWALGLALMMRGDAKGAASTFRAASDAGCPLPEPPLRAGLLPARELAQATEALRGLARHGPAPGARAVALAAISEPQ